MTKVQMRLELDTPLEAGQLARLSGAHGLYGLHRVLPEPNGTWVTVDYDASRLTAAEVSAALRRVGIPVRVATVTT